MDTPQSGQQLKGWRFFLRIRACLEGRERLSFLVPILAVLVLPCILAIDCLDVQEKPEPRNLLFGVPLSREARSLLAEVEQLFETQVREEWLDETDGMSGKSKVDDDGTPIIKINPAHGRTLDVIVHELYHLKLRARGYPDLKWLFPQEMNTEANRAAFNQLAVQLRDPIEHYIFYDDVRAWGLNPGESFEKLTKQALAANTLVATFETMDNEAVGLYYFKIRLEVADTVLVQRLTELLEHKKKQSGIEFGKRLSQIVIDANPRSPEEEIKTLVDCLNALYERKLFFRQHPWTTRLLGKRKQQLAQIELVPLR
ncbi:MAG TPA: hypothetical protein VEM37_04995 [Nitrospiraceae bacterium]|nr:hypothetical protein [Nitrospiraceae bacterium]